MKKGIYAGLAILTVFAIILGVTACPTDSPSGDTKYTVKFDLNEGAGTTPASITQKTVGGSITLPPGTGLTGPSGKPIFAGWSDNKDATAGLTGSYTPKKSLTLFAIWSAGITIKFDTNVPDAYDGATLDAVVSVTLASGVAIGTNLPAAPTADGAAVEGMVFLGWFSAATDGTQITATTSWTAGTTVYAHWKLYDPQTEVAITFKLNYTDAPPDIVKVGPKAAWETEWPADPTRTGTVEGLTNPNDTWVFKGWKQYEAGSGDAYTSASVMPGSVIDNTVWAYWEPSTGWPVEAPPATVNLAGAEKVTLENAWYVVYKFELPSGKKWSDYQGITADYMVGPRTLDKTNSSRAIRLMGNYVDSDFGLHAADEGVVSVLPNIAIASYNNDKNTPYIFDDLNQSWKTIAAALTSMGISAGGWEWFTIPYKIDGSRANSGYVASHKPGDNDTGPFYFGLGIPGQGEGGTTQWIRNVKLIGNTASDTINGTPLWFKKGATLYPAFTGYPNVAGGDGFKEASRAMVDGSQPAPVVLPESLVITLNENYTGAPTTPVTIDYNTALGARLTTPTRATYYFLEWNTKADGTGDTVTAATVFTENATIYAKWIAAAEAAVVTFNPNNGAAVSTKIIPKDTALGADFPAALTWNTYYDFVRWNLRADGKGLAVTSATKFLADTTVYAVWQAKSLAPKDLVYLSTDPALASEAQIKIAKEYTLTTGQGNYVTASALQWTVADMNIPLGFNLASYNSYTIKVKVTKADNTVVDQSTLAANTNVVQFKFSRSASSLNDPDMISVFYNLGGHSPDGRTYGIKESIPADVLNAPSAVLGMFIQGGGNLVASAGADNSGVGVKIEITDIIFHTALSGAAAINLNTDDDALFGPVTVISDQTWNVSTGDLKITAPGFDSYQWLVGGTVQSGATGNTLTLAVGDYTSKINTNITVTAIAVKDGNPYSKTIVVAVKR